VENRLLGWREMSLHGVQMEKRPGGELDVSKQCIPDYRVPDIDPDDLCSSLARAMKALMGGGGGDLLPKEYRYTAISPTLNPRPCRTARETKSMHAHRCPVHAHTIV